MPDLIRPAERRDLSTLQSIADAQAAARCALDRRLPRLPQVAPFLSDSTTLSAVYGARNHAAFVAERGGVVVAGLNLHKIEQRDEDEFASYYPRRFTSIGLLAARPDAADALPPLLDRAAEQAARWRSPALMYHNAAADRALNAALRARGFRTYYHYAMRDPAASYLAPAADGITVRRATPDDLDATVRIGMQSVTYHAAHEPTMEPARSEPRKMRGRFELILREMPNATIIVAEWQGQVVGFYTIYIQNIDEAWMPPLFASGRYGLIAEVAVDERLRGHGIGRRLFAAVDEWFRNREVRAYWLIYLPGNPLSSRFWPSLDFRPVWEVLYADAPAH
ncbi:MAG: GNAT family N-acetyltransferase [Chloroflexi bacterium]|nr:GNAT family N-acetyltransferase [Chloroflexota bacterium]